MYFKFTHILICWGFLITNKDMEADVFTLDFWRMESDSAASATYQIEMWKRENSRVTVKTNKPKKNMQVFSAVILTNTQQSVRNLGNCVLFCQVTHSLLHVCFNYAKVCYIVDKKHLFYIYFIFELE